MTVPRLVIAAPQGRSGKTTLSIGLCASFARRGLAIQPFKKGPDYIDPTWLSAAAGRSCRNLDPFLMTGDALLASFRRSTRDADLALVEGAMGLFDGVDLEGSGSTAQVARLLHAPVILVVNAVRMTRSIAALVAGFQHFEDGVDVAGVILNSVATGRHESMLAHAIQRYCGLPVLGAVPKDERLGIPDRHLGLIPFGEEDLFGQAVEMARVIVERYVDTAAVLALARGADDLPEATIADVSSAPGDRSVARARIAVVRDRAFSFYYPENLEALEQAGGEIVYMDALRDQSLPAVDGLYIGGGFPEVFLAELESNVTLRSAIARAIDDGLPTYAECGGLMYLAREVRWGDRHSQMVGALPCAVELQAKPQGHGYVVAEVTGQNGFFPVGTTLAGHEFHHSKLVDAAPLSTAYQLRRGRGLGGGVDGIVHKNVLASYLHLHALTMPSWAERFVALAATGGRAVHAAQALGIGANKAD